MPADLTPQVSVFNLLLCTGTLAVSAPTSIAELKNYAGKYYRCPSDHSNFEFDGTKAEWVGSYIFWNYDSTDITQCDGESSFGKWRDWCAAARRVLVGRDSPGAVIFAEPAGRGGVSARNIPVNAANHPGTSVNTLIMDGSVHQYNIPNQNRGDYLMCGWARFPLDFDF